MAVALDGWLVIEESADIGTGDQTVTFAELAAVGSYNGMNPITTFPGAVGQDFEL